MFIFHAENIQSLLGKSEAVVGKEFVWPSQGEEKQRSVFTGARFKAREFPDL